MNENDNITRKKKHSLKYEQADKEIIVKDQKDIEKSIVKSKWGRGHCYHILVVLYYLKIL